MRSRVPSTRTIIVVVPALAAVGAGLLFWWLWRSDDGTVPVLAAICVSPVAIDPIVSMKVDEKTEIDGEVLGARVRGTCRTTGTVQIKLTPNPTKAAFELSLIGESVSDTVATHGPAQISSRAVTKYKAVKLIIFDGDSFTSSPAKVAADTDLTINNVSSTTPGILGQMVTKVATHRAREAREESRRIASERTIKQVSRQFDAAVGKHLDQLNRDLQLEQLLDQHIADRDSLPMRLRTTEEGLHVLFLAGVGTPRRVPEFAGAPNLAVQIGLNLIALAKNPAKTIRTIRHLYEQRQAKKADANEPAGKGPLGLDLAHWCAVEVGTQDGWVMVEVTEGVGLKATAPEK